MTTSNLTTKTYWISSAEFYNAVLSGDVAMKKRLGQYYVERLNGEAITYGTDRETVIGHLEKAGADKETIVRLLRSVA